jgi:hypothetical protein
MPITVRDSASRNAKISKDLWMQPLRGITAEGQFSCLSTSNSGIRAQTKKGMRMMERKPLALVIMAIMTLWLPPWVAIAQQATRVPKPEEIRERVATARTRLKLTPDQTGRLESLLKEEATNLRAVESKYSNDSSLQGRRARIKEARAVQNELREKLTKVLSKEQMTEWDKMREEARARAREERRQRSAPSK